MKKDKITFVGTLAKWGNKDENRRCIIIPLDELSDVRSNFDDTKFKVTFEKLKL